MSTADQLEDAANVWHPAHDRLATTQEPTFDAAFRAATAWLSTERTLGLFSADRVR
jgi:hypothetical protein